MLSARAASVVAKSEKFFDRIDYNFVWICADAVCVWWLAWWLVWWLGSVRAWCA